MNNSIPETNWDTPPLSEQFTFPPFEDNDQNKRQAYHEKRFTAAIEAMPESGGGGLLNPRTMANCDSLRTGVPGKITIGRRVVYSVDALLEWMKKRS